MQLEHMKHRLLYNQMSCPLVVRRENAAVGCLQSSTLFNFHSHEVGALTSTVEKLTMKKTKTIIIVIK